MNENGKAPGGNIDGVSFGAKADQANSHRSDSEALAGVGAAGNRLIIVIYHLLV